MVKTMKRGVSLMFVLSLLVSMLMIPAKATNTTKSVTVPSYSNALKYVSIHTDKSFLGWKTTTVTVTNTSGKRTIALYHSIGGINYAGPVYLRPGQGRSFSAKANGAVYSFQVQRTSGKGDATVQFRITNGY